MDSDDETLEKRYNLTKIEEKYANIDHYLLEKIRKLREDNLKISYEILKCLCSKYFKETGMEETKITMYFLKNFVKRNGLRYITLHGEAASADQSQLQEFKDKLKDRSQNYEMKDIFNIDETALYIKNTKNKSFVIDVDHDNKNVKCEKTRISILVGCNTLGEKLPLLAIGKSNNPRCFKNINMNKFTTIYRSSKTSWLTGEIFNEYCEILNAKLISESRKILIILDNFSGHKIGRKSNIEFLFLQPNCTSIAQPLDMGIINSFKSKYNVYLNNFFVSMSLDEDMKYKDSLKKVDFIYVLQWIERGFNNVTVDTIVNG